MNARQLCEVCAGFMIGVGWALALQGIGAA